jgi:hypothetical protein
VCAVCVNAPDEPRGFCHLQRPPGGGRANTSDTAGVCRGVATNSLIHSFTFCLPTPLSALTSTTRFLRRIICVIFLLAAFREKLTAWKQIKEKVFEIFSDVNENSLCRVVFSHRLVCEAKQFVLVGVCNQIKSAA